MPGVLEVHDNVVFEANTAEYGGAVSLPLNIGFQLDGVVECETFCGGSLILQG